MRDERDVRPVALLDRDGTIIEDEHYLADPAHIRFCAGAVAGLTLLRDAGFRLAVITNQSGIARGYLSEQTLELIHVRLAAMLALHGIVLDAIYHCPHGPDDGCDCRKPLPGMIERAAAELDFGPDDAVVFGDAHRDMLAAQAFGALGIQVYASGASPAAAHVLPTLSEGAACAIRTFESRRAMVSERMAGHD